MTKTRVEVITSVNTPAMVTGGEGVARCGGAQAGCGRFRGWPVRPACMPASCSVGDNSFLSRREFRRLSIRSQLAQEPETVALPAPSPGRSGPARSKSSLPPAGGCGSPGPSPPRQCRRCSRRRRRPGGDDDRVPGRRAGMLGGWPHRYAQGLRWIGVAGPGDAQARSARRPFVGVPRASRRAHQVLWHDGRGLCLFAERLERGRFIWPSPADGVATISPAQLGYLREGIDWRMPQYTWRPQWRYPIRKRTCRAREAPPPVASCRPPGDVMRGQPFKRSLGRRTGWRPEAAGHGPMFRI
jgi:transposase